MELDDLDLGSSWPLDQISFASSNFRFPSSEQQQPFSPLWSFSSGDAAGELPTLLADYSLLLASKLSSLSLDSNNANGYALPNILLGSKIKQIRFVFFFFLFLMKSC